MYELMLPTALARLVPGNQVSFTTSVAVLPVLTTTAVTNITQTTATSGGNVTSNGGVSLTAGCLLEHKSKPDNSK